MSLPSYKSSPKRLRRQGGCFDLAKKRERKTELATLAAEPNLWDNPERARAVTQELADTERELAAWESLEREVRDTAELAHELSGEGDADLSRELTKKTHELAALFDKLSFAALFTGLYDSRGAIVSISAGAGGTDAQDWAEMLEAMLGNYAERRGFRVKSVDRQRGQEAGIKSSTFEVAGSYAYGWFASEAGVHRLVRISPFDAEAMRHTSFALVDVVPDLGDVADIEIRDEDVRIDVYRSSGHGGQSVNTTDSAVRMVHIPTGITVTCQNERSQHQNKATALKILKSRLAARQEAERQAKERSIRGQVASAEWGSQIRSYVLHPYKLVKDHRTGLETSDVDAVLGGDLDAFSEAYIRFRAKVS
ncbi:MAG: peptide chain release factor 2 [Parcubacteria group bacterium]|nr:peptide chain release factor 2 [Parcubacteria group bacterium]